MGTVDVTLQYLLLEISNLQRLNSFSILFSINSITAHRQIAINRISKKPLPEPVMALGEVLNTVSEKPKGENLRSFSYPRHSQRIRQIISILIEPRTYCPYTEPFASNRIQMQGLVHCIPNLYVCTSDRKSKIFQEEKAAS